MSVALATSNPEPRWPTDAPRVAETQKKLAATAPAPVAHAATRSAPETEARGVIQSQAEAVIASRITARITSMPYKLGQSFGSGAVLASFDCSQARAQLNAANAATAAYRKTYETNVELDAYKAIGTNDVAVSKANMAKAAAEATAISSGLTDCAIRAPFAGRVVEQVAHQHEVAASGAPLMKIQNGNELEVQLIVPSRWLTWLTPGTPFRFKIDETGATLNASITRLGASVDPVSKTLRVIGFLNRGTGTVLPGMSGSAQFDMPTASDGKQS
ncbi:efflux RND transporter periplasmic adaptor subunit [Sphingomonas prati]|uniref:RND family efflux transporter MFP subunit n=1 Tax=Sphingomonas prati TaxID=1843237 RepID=A0A7W9BWD5_9SPHN|nr:efflux RND transporter periplasmic adaptor subunit [Sphingomonas prati]MBB5730868.1 RND family efflux transporter MFP subunit [Sphingomonas prati]